MFGYENIKDTAKYLETLKESGTEFEIYSKFERIKARQGRHGEPVLFRTLKSLENPLALNLGRRAEIKRKILIVNNDPVTGKPDWIVEASTPGEYYLLSDSKFMMKYELDKRNTNLLGQSQFSIFQPSGGYVYAVPVDKKITFINDKGKRMRLQKDDYLIMSNNKKIKGMSKEAFDGLYARSYKNGKFYDDKYNLDIPQKVKSR